MFKKLCFVVLFVGLAAYFCSCKKDVDKNSVHNIIELRSSKTSTDAIWNDVIGDPVGEFEITTPNDMSIYFVSSEGKVEIKFKVIDNSTMILQAPITIEFPNEENAISRTLNFPKGTKITVGKEE